MYFRLESSYNPFTYDDLIKPLLLYKDSYDKTYEALSTMGQNASVIGRLINKYNDPKSFKRYNDYLNNLENYSNLFNEKGLNRNVGKAMQQLRNQFAYDVAPINVAYQRKQALVDEQRKAYAANPTMLYERDANDISLDELVDNPTVDYGHSYSGNLLTSAVSNAVSGLKTAINEGKLGKLKSLGLPYQYQRLVQRGATADEILAAIQNKAAEGDSDTVKFLRNTVSNTIKSSGIADWADLETLKKAYYWANQGLYSAIGQSDLQILKDDYSIQSALVDAQAKKKAAEDNLKKKLSGIPTDIRHLMSPNKDQTGENAEMLLKLLSGKHVGLLEDTMEPVKGSRFGAGTMTSKVKTKNKNNNVYWFYPGGTLASKADVMAQGTDKASREYIGKVYDQVIKDIKNNYSIIDEDVKLDKESITNLLNTTKQNGAYNLAALDIWFGSNGNKEAFEKIITSTDVGDGKAEIRKINSFDRDGNIELGERLNISDLYTENKSMKTTPRFFLPPAADGENSGLIVKFGGDYYQVPKRALGSLGEGSWNIDLPALNILLQKRRELRNALGDEAYVQSYEGALIEDAIDNAGGLVVSNIANTLGYELKPTIVDTDLN